MKKILFILCAISVITLTSCKGTKTDNIKNVNDTVYIEDTIYIDTFDTIYTAE